jgi:hypothetical protein
MWWHTSLTPDKWKAELGGSQSEGCPIQKWEILSELRQKGWLMAQVLEHLPGKCEALSSNPSTADR